MSSGRTRSHAPETDDRAQDRDRRGDDAVTVNQRRSIDWFPGVRIRQTSAEEYGQIYVPFVNWMMMLLTIALTVGFGSSDRLAGAYGTAVSTTMLLTTALLYKVMRDRWGWPAPAALLTSGLFLVVDFAFFGANLLKSSRAAGSRSPSARSCSPS